LILSLTSIIWISIESLLFIFLSFNNGIILFDILENMSYFLIYFALSVYFLWTYFKFAKLLALGEVVALNFPSTKPEIIVDKLKNEPLEINDLKMSIKLSNKQSKSIKCDTNSNNIIINNYFVQPFNAGPPHIIAIRT